MGGKVYLSPNPVKTSERIDFDGNVIDSRTKQVLVPKEVEYVPPVSTTVVTPITTTLPASPVAKDDGLSILEQIEATKKRLVELEELKKVRIAEKKKELELLEQ